MIDYFDKSEFDNAIHADDPVALWIASNGGPYLLAAAPDLLAALQGLERHCVTPGGVPDRGKGRTEDQQRAMDAARAAIAKATGGAQ